MIVLALFVFSLVFLPNIFLSYTPAGYVWTSRSSAAENYWNSVTFGNGLFVAVAATGTGNRVMTSPDGMTWTSRSSAADNGWQSVTFGNGLFVAVAFSGVGNRVMTSPDFITLTILSRAFRDTFCIFTGRFFKEHCNNSWNRREFGIQNKLRMQPFLLLFFQPFFFPPILQLAMFGLLVLQLLIIFGLV